MEPFENGEFETGKTPSTPEDPQLLPPQPEPQPAAYHGTGAGRKESPYASSPYEMQEPARQEYGYRPQTEPPVKAKKAKKSRKPIWKGLLAGALAVLLVVGSCAATAAVLEEHYEEEMERTLDYYGGQIRDMQEQIDSLSKGNAAFSRPTDGSAMTPTQLYASSVNSVVAISTTIQANSFYGPTQGSSSGSGFILTEDGYVITNYHVVENATAISVITHDSTEYPATLVGSDATNDLAVLKVEATGLAAAPLGSSTDLMIGDMVVAIGNPLGELTFSLTSGTISALDREVTFSGGITMNLIQTDCAINSGNSGGALFNMYGEVVGVTNAKYSSSSASEASIDNIGFAIPINSVRSIVESIIEKGYIAKPYIGISVMDVSEQNQLYGVPAGVAIQSVSEDSPAEEAGLQAGDIITAVNGQEMDSNTLVEHVKQSQVGDELTLSIYRQGETMEVVLTVGEQVQSALPQQEVQPTQSQSWSQSPFDGFFGGRR